MRSPARPVDVGTVAASTGELVIIRPKPTQAAGI
jgi:hypothetical protein